MLAPVPPVVKVPGYRVNIQVPVWGRPFNTTLPVDNEHVGAVIDPTRGVWGIPCWAVITILEDEGEVHPDELETEYVNTPSGRFVMVAFVPEPVVNTLPGVRVSVHVPVEGNPDNTTLPVDTVHDG